ncbi:epoxide hydrolase family protein [Hymenobacter defluvii]|uniref:Epoxide hydrolase n=1 Tax=Hymenobacter defluvii TaxID=2054411 RepID=A0ABS3TGK9_9BACT|nr:epoxide hydrolase family protein [Hymenobacter defluvii]MBO3272323.1 epoxide hydrolase [Hymenobacter defluvii]
MNHSPDTTIYPHPFAFPDAALADLRDRLARTRWPDSETVPDWRQGVPLATMQALCTYWRDGYDWRACEARLNALSPSRTQIDGLAIHFLHLRSPEPDAVPLVLTHGWPGSVIEFLKVAPMLADPRAHGGDPKDAFHVVLPTLPNFGLSEKLTTPDWSPERVARAWVELMRRLGYEGFFAQGGDWGYAITNALGGIGAPAVRAVHFNMFPIFAGMEAVDAQEQQALARLQAFAEHENGYMTEQIQSPQTLGYGLTDSPVGQAAWIYELVAKYTDGNAEELLGRDAILDNITLYWLTATAAASARIYWQSMRTFREHSIQVPVGFSQFPRDIHQTSRRWVQERYPTLVYYNELPQGGHFPAWEQPALFVEEVRASFRHSR